MAKLGQHFLKNKKILERIAAALELKGSETVIEIGPGHGELTDEIINFGMSLRGSASWRRRSNLKIKIIAIEKDKQLAQALREKYRNDARVEIIEGDALKILPKLFQVSRSRFQDYKLVGNIPYYITGKLLRILSELPQKPEKIILLMQKEVAQRICAPKYKEKMNLLALATQLYAEPKILFYVSSGNFEPAPKVDSAVIEIRPTASVESLKRGTPSFLNIARVGFRNKRKFLISNLAVGLKISKEELEKIFREAGIDARARAEDLALEDWQKLAQMLLLIIAEVKPRQIV